VDISARQMTLSPGMLQSSMAMFTAFVINREIGAMPQVACHPGGWWCQAVKPIASFFESTPQPQRRCDAFPVRTAVV